MKLVTFEHGKRESWGIVLKNPSDNRLWVYEPGRVDYQLQKSASSTNGYAVSMPSFMTDCRWPDTMEEFLALEDEGMFVLERLERFLIRFLKQGDEARMFYSGYPIDDVQLLSPIPRPRLMWGLVQNCPTFVRSSPKRTNANLFPQGHQRPQGSVVGHGQLFYQPPETGTVSYNVELGVVIGKKGRYIPVNEAMKYVAGYTVVIDSQVNGYYKMFDPNVTKEYAMAEEYDWFVDAACSWGGKMADAHCTVGPWLVTPDEVGNPYDLLTYTRMNGRNRDRAHTSALLLGIERTIQWYSSFATLYPGDIIHMGTMGTDGLQFTPDIPFNGPENTVESEIEDIGIVKSPLLNMDFGDWRSPDDPTRLHVSPVVRKLIQSGEDRIGSVDKWSLDGTRHFWTIYKNYSSVSEKEGLIKLEAPRFLNAPASALGTGGAVTEIPPRAAGLEIGIELACVLGGLVSGVDERTAEESILGYTPMISITDKSFADVIVEPATRQERGMPTVYGRWADKFNLVSAQPVQAKWNRLKNRKMFLRIEGVGEVNGNTDEYVSGMPQSLSFISTYITCFPGDVMTLGQIGQTIFIPKEKRTGMIKIIGGIEGLGEVGVTLRDAEESLNTSDYNHLNL